MARVFAASVSVIGALTVAPGARAWTLGGYAGSAEIAGDATCFSESWGVVKQTGCGGAARPWVVHTMVNTNNFWNANLWIQQSSANQVLCGAVTQTGNNQDGGTSTWTWSGNVGSTSTGAVSINFGDWEPPAGGYLYVYCYLPQNTSLLSVNWSDSGFHS
jgi:hypothetical protein